jgi:hypothetical protein
MTIEIEKTGRGFAMARFEDSDGHSCTLQKSSVADQGCIWIGCDEIGLKRFAPGLGWQDVSLASGAAPDGISHIANNRMHLTREQVAELLPLLQRFVETGELS